MFKHHGKIARENLINTELIQAFVSGYYLVKEDDTARQWLHD